MGNAGGAIKKIIRRLANKRPQFGIWTPTNYVMPKEEGWYLTSTHPCYLPRDCDPVCELYWDGKDWLYEYWEGGKVCAEVFNQNECPIIAWMPKPKPYLVIDEKTNEIIKPL